MPETLQPLKALNELEQAVLFHARERRKSLAGVPEMFRTHQIFGGTVMTVASIATATFPVRTGEVTFKTAIRFSDNTSTRTGLIFEFGSSTAGVAIWIEDQQIGFRAGGLGDNGALATFANGAQWPAGLELDIVASVRPGLGIIEIWLNGQTVLKAQSDAFTQWAASSEGSFAAAVQGTTPSDVVQTGAPSNFAVIEPLSVYIGQRPRQMVSTVATVFDPLTLSPILWLDASDGDTITSAAGLVSLWEDKSTSGLDFSQATSTARPTTGTNTINGLNVINFDGTSDYISASSSASFKQLFFVATAETGITTLAGLFARSGQQLENIRIEGTSFDFIGNGDTAETFADFTNSGGEMRVDGAVAELVVADTPFILSAVSPANSFFVPRLSQVFGARYWRGDIAEVLAFTSELSTSDRETLQNYLAARWGITLA